MKSNIQIANELNELRDKANQSLQNAFQAANDDEKKILAKQSFEQLQEAFIAIENPYFKLSKILQETIQDGKVFLPRKT